MNFFIVLIIVGFILVGWGVFLVFPGSIKGSFLAGWRAFQINKERKKEQKK